MLIVCYGLFVCFEFCFAVRVFDCVLRIGFGLIVFWFCAWFVALLVDDCFELVWFVGVCFFSVRVIMLLLCCFGFMFYWLMGFCWVVLGLCNIGSVSLLAALCALMGLLLIVSGWSCLF